MDPSGSQGNKPIPKFASFKPKPAPQPEADQTRDHRRRESPVSGARDRHEEAKHRSRHKSHRQRSRSRERSPNRDTHRRSHEKRGYDPSDQQRDVSSHAKIPLRPEEGGSDLFVVDRKGDRYNVTYGTLHRYSVPQYYRTGRGSVLGLPSRYKIDRDATDGTAVVIRTDTWRADGSRPKSKSALAKLNKQGSRLLRVRRETDADPTDATKDFLPLSANGSRKRRKILDVSDSEDDRHGYRSIEGKAKPSQDFPSDLEAASDTDMSGVEGGRIDLEEEVKQRNLELSRHVEDHPSDLDAWLQLINHQEALLGGVGRDSRGLTYAEQRSLADIKLSLYDKALKRVGPNPSKDRLLLGFLEEGAKVWDTKKLSKQWHAILKTNSRYISLWVKYLDFRQTEFLGFTYERCKATFLECMQLNASSPDTPEKVKIQTYLFLRMTLFMRQAGFAEHAVGLWQAILEFIFFRPDSFDRSNDFNGALSSFREFWESEVARIGELGAKGWKSGNSAAVEPTTTISQRRIDPGSIFASWLECEKGREINARLPARTLDEIEEDDPYRVILFSDVQDLLSLFWGLGSRHLLIDSFLYFCYLPALSSEANVETCRQWNGDAFLRNELLNISESALAEWFRDFGPDEQGPLISPSSFIPSNFIHTLDTLLLNQSSWFCSLRSWTDTAFNGRMNLDPDWVRRTVRSLVDATPGNDVLSEYSLALEYVCNSKEAKKYAKSLLKRAPSNLRLYNVYGLIEYRSGNAATAEKVWMTTLSMSKDFSDTERLSCALLWCTWLWEALRNGQINKAVRLLLSIPQGHVDVSNLPGPEERINISPAEFLKTQRSLNDGQEYSLSLQNVRVFVAYTECLAMLFYLSHSSDLDNAIKIFGTALERLDKMPSQAQNFVSFTTELLHQTRAKLLYYHVTERRTYRPSQIRTLLAESLSLFPHNTMFLTLFAWNESRFRIEERVRDVVQEITTQRRRGDDQNLSKQAVPITSHLFAIYTELHRPVFSGSTIYSVRAAFEKAIGVPILPSTTSTTTNTTNDPSSARTNLSLWKLYILFELSRGHASRAKEVFFRAMRACPWSKELMVLAFSHLSADHLKDKQYQDQKPPQKPAEEGMSFEELRRVYNVLVEKELRLHVDIEDELEEIEEKMERRRLIQGRQGKSTVPIEMPEDADTEEDEYGPVQ